MCGCEVRGPVTFVKERLCGDEAEASNFLDYVCGFQERLCEVWEVVWEHLKRTMRKCVEYRKGVG